MIDFNRNLVVVRSSLYEPVLNLSNERKMKLVSGRLSDSNWVSTAPRGVGSFISNDFSPNQFYYMVTQAIN